MFGMTQFQDLSREGFCLAKSLRHKIQESACRGWGTAGKTRAPSAPPGSGSACRNRHRQVSEDRSPAGVLRPGAQRDFL